MLLRKPNRFLQGMNGQGSRQHKLQIANMGHRYRLVIDKRHAAQIGIGIHPERSLQSL